MTPLTKAGDIAEYLSTLLATITVANGFETDIGANAYRGRRDIDDEAVPCAVLIEGEDRPGDQAGRGSLKITQDYVLGGYVLCDPNNPNDAAHKVLRDLKRAVFNVPPPDRGPSGGPYTLGGRVKECRYMGRDIGPRTDGNAIVFAVIRIQVDYAETLTDP